MEKYSSYSFFQILIDLEEASNMLWLLKQLFLFVKLLKVSWKTMCVKLEKVAASVLAVLWII